jgi:hypothetical protein
LEEIPKKIMAKIPLEFLLYILSSGFLLFVFFPFDFSLFVPSSEKTLPAINDIGYTIFMRFAPFINLKYFGGSTGDFPIHILQITLGSLSLGLIMNSLQGFFGYINHKISRGGAIKNYLKKKRLLRKEVKLTTQEQLNFYKWLKKNKLGNEFYDGIHQISVGCLYAAEAFAAINLVRVLLIAITKIFFPNYWTGLSSSVFLDSFLIDSLLWFVVAIILGLVFYINYLISLRNNERIWNELKGAFKKTGTKQTK